MKDKKMAESKIEFSFENLHFSCAGDNDWVEKQLNNVLNRIPALLSIHQRGENAVEEVIEVNAEEVNEVTAKARGTKFKAGKGLRDAPNFKTPKTSKPAKEKSVKTPKIKVAKIPKIAKVPKIKVAKVAGAFKTKGTAKSVVAGDVIAPKLVKKRGIIPSSALKEKAARKEKAIIRPVIEQIDSPLSRFISDKKAGTNQVRKFLATAVFLARNNNVTRLSTPMISKALKSYGIQKLQNASDCLNKNEKKGYCTKEGKEFIINENGFLAIE
jgi:hypothetical protein